MGLVPGFVLGIAKSRKRVLTVWLRENVFIPEAKTILLLPDCTQFTALRTTAAHLVSSWATQIWSVTRTDVNRRAE